MIAIELTEEHKEKLLEMCKTLFPEYEKIWITFTGPIMLLGYLRTNKSPYVDFNIHWFEFCLTQLAKKILSKMPDMEKPYLWTFQGLLLLHHNEEHLIDSLYEQLKKLK